MNGYGYSYRTKIQPTTGPTTTTTYISYSSTTSVVDYDYTPCATTRIQITNISSKTYATGSYSKSAKEFKEEFKKLHIQPKKLSFKDFVSLNFAVKSNNQVDDKNRMLSKLGKNLHNYV